MNKLLPLAVVLVLPLLGCAPEPSPSAKKKVPEKSQAGKPFSNDNPSSEPFVSGGKEPETSGTGITHGTKPVHGSDSGAKSVHVNGYMRNGKYVQSYDRAAPGQGSGRRRNRR